MTAALINALPAYSLNVERKPSHCMPLMRCELCSSDISPARLRPVTRGIKGAVHTTAAPFFSNLNSLFMRTVSALYVRKHTLIIRRFVTWK